MGYNQYNIKYILKVGDKFNRLSILEIPNSGIFVKFKCDCGNIVLKRKWDVVHNKTKSCGCLIRELTGWSKGLTIERKNIKENYCPENCCWIPMSEQTKNKSDSNKITAFGETKNITDWTRDSRCNVTRVCILRRIKRGLSAEDAISLPRDTFKSKRKSLNVT